MLLFVLPTGTKALWQSYHEGYRGIFWHNFWVFWWMISCLLLWWVKFWTLSPNNLVTELYHSANSSLFMPFLSFYAFTNIGKDTFLSIMKVLIYIPFVKAGLGHPKKGGRTRKKGGIGNFWKGKNFILVESFLNTWVPIFIPVKF